MRNVEIKARVHDFKTIRILAEKLSGAPPTIIYQNDTFYNVNTGRLKLRRYGDGSATLVRYDREDEQGPKLSSYDLLDFSVNDTDQIKTLDNMMKKCLGVRGKVLKERIIYMVGPTRIHLDKVEDLGDFMELEVLLNSEQTFEDGQTIAKTLQNLLGVKDEDLISGAYVDLLDKK
ncbi:unnamed protein product [Euphydryas editha]|uniref:CYTH domain-containing protein n=1 Tax=Euphydryas editha TaxID=104508 RepID=A0AAU9VBZ0_EUPED|nr:unnamed protein product [Euphydryas editha]